PVVLDAAGHFALSTSLPLDGSGDGVHAARLTATDVAGNVGVAGVSFTLDTSTPAPPCDFSAGLADWGVDERGGDDPGRGTVAVEGADAVLREGNSFVVALSRTFTVPARPSVVSFMFDGPAFDTAAAGLIKDAFE